jgi:hypothetical protein
MLKCSRFNRPSYPAILPVSPKERDKMKGITIEVTIPEEGVSRIFGEFLKDLAAEMRELRESLQALQASNQDTIDSTQSLDGKMIALITSVDRLEREMADTRLSRSLPARPS